MSADVILPTSSPLASTSAAVVLPDGDQSSPGPFEGPEKLLEVWFAPSVDALPRSGQSSSSARQYRSAPAGSRAYEGLRQVPRAVWEEMLDIVKCKVLSVVEGEDIDAYLLSESSLFVAPHLLILKTCGTTLNLLGLHRIIEIAREYCGFTNIWRCFYSRKSFFFPERQSGPHKDWRDEVNFLDGIFGSSGSAYTVGPMNRDHWLLYLTSPNTQPLLPSDSSLSSSFHLSLPSPSLLSGGTHLAVTASSATDSAPAPPSSGGTGSIARIVYEDTTLEILMSHLSPEGRAPFFQPSQPSDAHGETVGGHELGKRISAQLGIGTLFGDEETQLDSFGFEPCGYSANAVIGSGLHTGRERQGRGSQGKGGGYFTIHVTPEEGWSYASFECNVPLPLPSASASSPGASSCTSSTSTALPTAGRPDLQTLIRRVVSIFQPNRLSITLFVSTPASSSASSAPSQGSGNGGITSADSQAWQSFGGDLLGSEFERKDRIGYEFEGYDLVFACFERRGWVEPGKDRGGRGIGTPL